MNFEQIKKLCNYCRSLGIKTLGELANFKAETGCRTNGELLNALIKAAKGGG